MIVIKSVIDYSSILATGVQVCQCRCIKLLCVCVLDQPETSVQVLDLTQDTKVSCVQLPVDTILC